MSRFLFATAAAAAILTASPAFAATTDWAAPLDDVPGREVRLFGLLPVPANEGTVDRGLRLAAAAGLAYVAVVDPFVAGPVLRAGAGAAGGIMGFTALTGACPLYMPFGLDTRMGRAPAAEPGATQR